MLEFFAGSITWGACREVIGFFYKERRQSINKKNEIIADSLAELREHAANICESAIDHYSSSGGLGSGERLARALNRLRISWRSTSGQLERQGGAPLDDIIRMRFWEAITYRLLEEPPNGWLLKDPVIREIYNSSRLLDDYLLRRRVEIV